MSYTKLTDFAAKDALLSGNPSKLLRGTEIGAEFDAIVVADALNLKTTYISDATAKTTPVDADLTPIADSAASNVIKKVTWVNIKATLKTYFDTLYIAVGGNIGAATATTPSASDNDTSVATTAFVQGELTSQAVKLTGTQTIAGVKTFSSMPVMPVQSMVRLNTANGYGSTNTKIRRFTTTILSQGTDITYADSASNGASFTINTAGVYAISYTECFAGPVTFGLSIDSAQLTTAIASITQSTILDIGTSGASGYAHGIDYVGYFSAGAVVRPHTDGGAASTSNQYFTITRIS